MYCIEDEYRIDMIAGSLGSITLGLIGLIVDLGRGNLHTPVTVVHISDICI